MKGKKTGGRQKGALNKVNNDLRQSITDFLQSNFDAVIKDWKKMESRDKLAFYKDLLKYAVPTLQSTDMKIDFDKMTDSQLNTVIEGILKEGKNE